MLLFATVLLTIISSVKFIVFGVGELDHAIFHFTQFVVVNNFMLKSSSGLWRTVSSFILWALFGLSPHDRTDPALNYLLEDDDHTPTPTPGPVRRLLGNSTTPTAIEEATEWIVDHKFLLTLEILFAISIISLIINWVYSLYRQGVCSRSNGFAEVEPALQQHRLIKYQTTDFTNFLMKIGLLCYCNLSTVTNAQLLMIDEAPVEMSFFAICALILFELGFPIYIFTLLGNNIHRLYDDSFRRKFGSLYLHFNPNPKDNRFILVVLAKQFLYAIFININRQLSMSQNTMILVVNLFFLAVIVKHSPYTEDLRYVQTVIMGTSTVLISAINYVFILETDGTLTHYVFNLANIVIHAGTYGSFIIIQLFRCRRRRQQKKKKRLISRPTGSVEMVIHNDALDRDHVIKIESRRFDVETATVST